jgi:hypothetical protein
MKTLITALLLATLIAIPANIQSAAAAPTGRRDAGQAEPNHDRSRHDGGYYHQNGTVYYDGYPLSEWLNQRDSW